MNEIDKAHRMQHDDRIEPMMNKYQIFVTDNGVEMFYL
jgi:hypothetical protein